MTLEERITKPGQKKILALDGGGIRGMMTVEVLAGIEKILRRQAEERQTGPGRLVRLLCRHQHRRHHRHLPFPGNVDRRDPAASIWPAARKCSTRPFFSGASDTSTRTRSWPGKLKEVFGADTTLGSDKLRTLLMMVMRNASTDSPWPLSNNPCAKYNQRDRKDCNLNLPLWQLVRASTAAPVYFPPEVVDIGSHRSSSSLTAASPPTTTPLSRPSSWRPPSPTT